MAHYSALCQAVGSTIYTSIDAAQQPTDVSAERPADRSTFGTTQSSPNYAALIATINAAFFTPHWAAELSTDSRTKYPAFGFTFYAAH